MVNHIKSFCEVNKHATNVRIIFKKHGDYVGEVDESASCRASRFIGVLVMKSRCGEERRKKFFDDDLLGR